MNNGDQICPQWCQSKRPHGFIQKYVVLRFNKMDPFKFIIMLSEDKTMKAFSLVIKVLSDLRPKQKLRQVVHFFFFFK